MGVYISVMGGKREEWLTIGEASEKIGRSPYTIYNWISRSERGVSGWDLKIKRVDGRSKRWIWKVEWGSLREADKGSARLAKYVGDDGLVYNGGDTLERVVRDRRRWVNGWVEEGKDLERILGVFDSYLHEEIESYYWEAMGDMDEGFGERDEDIGG